VLFLDADDELDKDAVRELLAAASPDVDLVIGGYVRVDPGGRRTTVAPPWKPVDWFEVVPSR
jgi:hypothetical protein